MNDFLALHLGFVAAAYLVGAIPFGLLVVRLVTGGDVRKVGSGNIGATNVARAAGKKMAAVVLLLDAAKGFAPALLARLLLPGEGAWVAAIAFAAFLGHCFPVYLRFRGGKGVATALGVALALVPWAALAGAIAWIAVFRLFRISSLGSLAGAGVATLIAFLFGGDDAFAWTIVAMAAVIVLRHKANIGRLLQREEHRV